MTFKFKKGNLCMVKKEFTLEWWNKGENRDNELCLIVKSIDDRSYDKQYKVYLFKSKRTVTRWESDMKGVNNE